ncbi:hypothetical protein Efla_002534 [Eimeria flavescens]
METPGASESEALPTRLTCLEAACMDPPSGSKQVSRGPLPFDRRLEGLPVVATATFCGASDCRHIVEAGRVPASGETTEKAAEGAAGPQTRGTEEQQLLSRSLAEAERAAVAFLAAAAKSAAGGRAGEEADTVGNDQLGLDDD